MAMNGIQAVQQGNQQVSQSTGQAEQAAFAGDTATATTANIQTALGKAGFDQGINDVKTQLAMLRKSGEISSS